MKDHFGHKWVKWVFRYEAVTLLGHSFYTHNVSTCPANLILHENAHKRQQAEEPFLFYPKYLFFNLTRGYKNNPYEIEARRAER